MNIVLCITKNFVGFGGIFGLNTQCYSDFKSLFIPLKHTIEWN